MLKKKIGILLLGACLICGLATNVRAEESTNSKKEVLQLEGYNIDKLNVGEAAEGNNNSIINNLSRADGIFANQMYISVTNAGVKIAATTSSTVTASKIGVENIKIQKLTTSGWVTIASNSGGYKTNSSYYGANATYAAAQKGVQYRATGTHYATINGKRYSVNNQTDAASY